jgi:hypothetical protein
MYPNVRAEMGRKNVNITALAKFLDLRIATVSNKLRKGKFTFSEAVKIKEFLETELSLEELFREESE